MTSDQFAALATLMGLRTGPAQDAARLVLVGGLSKAEAARQAGCAPQSADQAVQRCQRVIGLARQVVGFKRSVMPVATLGKSWQ